MSLHIQIKDQVKEAMKARDEVRLRTLRGLLAAFTNELVSLKRKPDGELSDEEALGMIRRGVKQRKDSIEQFEKGGRADLAENEKAEMVILETYLPQMMSRDAVMKIAENKKQELGISDKSGAGKLMGVLMKELKGQADGDTVKSVVDELLQK
jgi:uncharacterized protein YqeY